MKFLKIDGYYYPLNENVVFNVCQMEKGIYILSLEYADRGRSPVRIGDVSAKVNRPLREIVDFAIKGKVEELSL